MRKPNFIRAGGNGGALLVLVVAVALLPLGIAASLVEHRNKEETQDRALASEAAEQTASIANYFERSRSLTQVMGRNPVYRQFYELPGERARNVRAGGPVITEANRALSYIEELFPDSIGEACFIDRSGPENARAVKGEIAPLSELSPDETGASFFGPTFALRPGQVYQAKPYLSPDTNEWVIANSTPIATQGGVTRAIVHFEVTIESFRKNAAQASDQLDVQILDAGTGAVIVDSRYPQKLGGELGRPEDRRFASVLHQLEGTGLLTVSGTRLGYEHLERRGQNANDWVVITMPRKPVGSWIQSLGISQIAMIIGSLLLGAFAAFNLRKSQRELQFAALNDSLTGLGNRRRLVVDLEEALSNSREAPFVLGLLDLDGFKAYNDTFGHAAGDSLLARLGRNLSEAVEGWGAAYRMGGDEFCIIAPLPTGESRRSVLDPAATALSEHGEGFTISASYGSVELPRDASAPIEALRIADQRMYSAKASSRTSASRQSTDVLITVLSERSAELGEHLGLVAEHSELVARELGLADEEAAEVKRAAALHDVGKLAIPDAILSKPGELTADEWEFIRRHPLIGERILGSAPALAGVAKMVRASHERFDGRGYPDGLAGEEIPLGARIIFVCDAFDAMTSDRPYRNAMSVEVALDELRRCAGSQFDPAVAEAFRTALAARLVDSPTIAS